MLENQFQYELLEAGCDEAGRGCLAGPVFAAAVILPPDFHDERLNDSKQMTERNRDRLREVIEREAVAWAVEAVSAARIDEINILNASFEGMSLAVGRLDPASGHALNYPTVAWSRATANMPTLRLPRYLPRPTVTSICAVWLRSIRSTAGFRTKATLRGSIGWPFANTV